ncbi:ABC transporter substrate-binding protein [Scrofimicrobium sp. R131]|uniref:ABC transporter substrate-binding protein n=1 Tax=Scrofimicrobium appendicitidis TaxID=3079930 RepID=A0AAU7V7Z4_9ACTO
MKIARRKIVGLAGSAAAGALILGACSGGGSISGTTEEQSSDASPAEGCEDFEQYGQFDGATVTLFSSIREVEADQLQETFDDFSRCTGITVQHNGVGEFEQQIVVQVEGNNAPDLAIFPQPGLLKTMVDMGKVLPAPEGVEKNTDEGWSPDWKAYGTVDGTFYAAPLMASVKSFVWYSPKAFADNGYEVPETWDELMALTQKIAEDNPDGDVKPWCAGIESGGATGWPATDWIEDLVLRTAGGDVYDQWVSHEIPFNDPAIVEATNKVGDILLNDDYVNGGIGDSRSIATTSFNDGGLPILDGQCFMHRQASFYEAQWPEGTDVSPDGDVYAFYLPGMDADNKPLLVAGEFVGAFNDKPETQAVQEYMSSGKWANTRVGIGGVTSANKAVDPSLASSDVLRLSIDLLQDEGAISRFDGSDLMPSEVGAGSFWSGLTQWIDGSVDTETMLTNIENSWPKN